MRRFPPSEGLDLGSAPLQRTQSSSSDASWMSNTSSLAPPPSVDPDPAYIAVSAASQLVTSEHPSLTSCWFDDAGNKHTETALVSPASLILINAFLDQLLFSFLASARSTSLLSLRPAVSEVLKPRLAREAILGADEELQEFLGGGDEEELSAFHNGQEPISTWDLNLVWKRTRLRCMVYTRLGDLEEEDEEIYIERDHLEDGTQGPHRLSRDLGIVSPAAAIFLTSILEFIGEHVLIVAGEAVSNRLQSTHFRANKRRSLRPNGPQRVVVEEKDVEKVVLNPTLGRLWRSWRKRVRSPSLSKPRPLSQESLQRRAMSSSASNPNRNASLTDAEDVSPRSDFNQGFSAAEALHGIGPASIPLPLSDNDVAEIEVPGYSSIPASQRGRLVHHSDSTRPYSLAVFPLDPPSPMLPDQYSMDNMSHTNVERMTSLGRYRSSSLPPSQQSGYVSPLDDESRRSLASTPPESPDSELYERRQEKTVRNGNADLNDGQHGTEAVIKPESSVIMPNDSSFLAAETSPRFLHQHATQESTNDVVNNTGGCDLQRAVTATDGNRNPEEPLQTSSRIASSVYSYTNDERGLSQPIAEGRAVLAMDPGDADIRSKGTFKPNSRPSSQRDPAPFDEAKEPRILTQDGDVVNVTPMQGRRSRADSENTQSPPVQQMASTVKRKSPFVLEPAPASRSERSSGNSSLSGRDLQPDGTLWSRPVASARVTGPESSLSPFTQPQELLYAARDNPDDPPAALPSRTSSKLQHSGLAKSGSLPSSKSSYTNQFSGGSKLSDLRHQLPPVNTGTERATVQRVSPSAINGREPVTPRSRRSTSSSRDGRPTHTSGSDTSRVPQKLKNLMAWQSGDGSKPSMPMRTSSDGSASMISDKVSQKSPRADDKQRSFEQLIKSDETIQYTLTPQNMREMEAPDSPRWTSNKLPETAATADFIRNAAPVSEEPARPSTGRSPASVKGLNGLRSNPVASAKQTVSPIPDGTSLGVVKAPVNASPRPASARSGHSIPREARVQEENTRDFADFIRSTGPEHKTKSITPNPAPQPITATRSDLATVTTPRVVPTSEVANPRKTRRSPNAVNPMASSKRAESGSLKRQEGRLEPREPTVPYGDQTSDLIDFIRQGPPHDRGSGSHRIPRTVAPFRRTMDSDEIHDLAHGSTKSAAYPSSVASTQDGSMQTKSRHSSSNSRTGLLDKSNRLSAKHAMLASSGQRAPQSDETPHPVRKQRRVKDPYALESDSDEENAVVGTSKPKRDQESLLDFLRSELSHEPANGVPSSSDVLPKSNGKALQNRSNGPDSRNRFNPSVSSSYNTKPTQTKNLQTASAPSSRGETPQLPPLDPRATSPHLISQVGSKLDMYKPTRPTYAAHVDRERNGSIARTGRMPQARSERDVGSSSNDLAAFLMNSEPPMTTTQPFTPNPGNTKEESGFIKMFSRKKKNTGFA